MKPKIIYLTNISIIMMLFVFTTAFSNQLAEVDSEFRVQEYIPYRPVNDLAKELKTSTYNSYENPTGIWIERGDALVITVPDTKGEVVSLLSKNWDTDAAQSYPLKQGVNHINATVSGNTYISYYTNNYKTAKPIKIQIQGGKVNGVFFRSKHNNTDWQKLLNNASSNYLDIAGKYCNMAFYVSALKANCPNDGVRLIELYDEIVEMQYEQMGLFKYNRVPKNHMFARNTLIGFMSAGGIGANLQYQTMTYNGNPSRMVTGEKCWGLAHELGHVNQVRPGLRWAGTVEVTNNFYTTYVQYMLTSKYSELTMRLEHGDCKPVEGEDALIGGRFNSHLHYGVLKGDKWMLQWGEGGKGDPFVKLVPLWQLNLYFKIANHIKSAERGKGVEWGKPDWFGDICELTRLDNATYTNGQHQINFIRRACEVTQTDLTDFFEKAGMLKPVNEMIDEYGSSKHEITQQMCDEVKRFVKEKGWKKPAGIINYISGNSIKAYADKLPVKGTLNQGVTFSGTSAVINHKVWKNAAVFETYAGGDLIRITMVGTGSIDNSSTRVPFPSNATRIVAVAWDGTKTAVFQK
jgi:hypothetical protein